MIEFKPEVVVKIRVERGITQAELSARAGITRPTIIKAEQGYNNINMATFVAILNALKITVEDVPLFFGEPILFRTFTNSANKATSTINATNNFDQTKKVCRCQ